MVKDAPTPEEALRAFKEFCGEEAVLVAHNSDFDTKFIFHKSKQFGIEYHNKVVDSLALCRLAFSKLKNHKLNTVAAHLRIPLDHHRAINDAVCTAEIMLHCFEEFEKNGARDMPVSYTHLDVYKRQLVNYAVAGGILAAISQLGDLSASFLKRSLGIKDFGKLLPGHGGVLDRIDSVLFCIPVVYLLMTMTII